MNVIILRSQILWATVNHVNMLLDRLICSSGIILVAPQIIANFESNRDNISMQLDACKICSKRTWRRFKTVALTFFVLVLGGCSETIPGISPTPTTGQSTERIDFFTVGRGDTWSQIAALHNTTVNHLWLDNGVANPDLLQRGLRLLISSRKLPQGKPLLRTSPRKENLPLLRLAVRSYSPIPYVLLVNGLERPEEALRGERLAVADARVIGLVGGGPTQIAATAASTLTPLPTDSRMLSRQRMGIQGYFQLDPVDMDFWLTKTADAGFTWVKYQVNWKVTEDPPDQYPLVSTLDAFFNNAQHHKMNVLLSVVKAPDWARETHDLDGPPKEYADYFNFVRFLASRYKDRLNETQIAFEIWNEPNTVREWSGAPLSAPDYLTLLSGSYVAIKAEESRYIVVSAGLAPTGVNDGVNAIDDRVYLRQMYDAGLARVTDAVGVHPYGWANPSDLRCCSDPAGPPVFNDDPRFFFLNTIEDYRAIQAEYGDSELHDLWATEFGWASMIGTGAEASPDTPWFNYVTPDQQAAYDLQAFLSMQDSDYMGPMFLWNLNMSTLAGFNADYAGYSLFLPNRTPRPAYELLLRTPKRP